MHGFFSQAAQDQDGDLVADDFEVHYGLSPLDPADAGLDLDLDGLTNLEEYRLGTCPEAIFSRFRSEFSVSEDRRTLTLRWMSRPGNRYVVERSDDLTSGNGWQQEGPEVVAPEGIAVSGVDVAIANDSPRGFFRIRLVESSVPLN